MTAKQETDLGALYNLYVYIEYIVNSGKYRFEPLELKYSVYGDRVTLYDMNDNIMRKGGGDFLENVKFNRYGNPDCGRYSSMNKFSLEKYVKKLDHIKNIAIKNISSNRIQEINKVIVEFK